MSDDDFKATDIEWDSMGRLVITNQQIIDRVTKYVRGNTNSPMKTFPVKGRSRDNRDTVLFQVVSKPQTTDPQDLLCGIIIEFPFPESP